jgi:hypothetical protein
MSDPILRIELGGDDPDDFGTGGSSPPPPSPSPDLRENPDLDDLLADLNTPSLRPPSTPVDIRHNPDLDDLFADRDVLPQDRTLADALDDLDKLLQETDDGGFTGDPALIRPVVDEIKGLRDQLGDAELPEGWTDDWLEGWEDWLEEQERLRTRYGDPDDLLLDDEDKKDLEDIFDDWLDELDEVLKDNPFPGHLWRRVD